MTRSGSARILIIDDEAAIRDALRMILEYQGYGVMVAATGEEGAALVEREAPDLVFLDIKMPGMDGLEVLQRITHLTEVTPVVVMSGHGTISTAVEATRLGAFDFIEKPLESERVLVLVRNAVDSRRLRTENRTLRKDQEKRHQIVGDSPGLATVRAAVHKAAPTNATVLIWGESGVGKELVARAVHRESLRRDGPFVQVNCAAIPDDLIESELFGHEKGSFTGATDRQIGKFEQADKGTIFLDEIGDMSLKTQAKVLRVLQEQELERLGSNRIIKVDVRVIAATNKNLEEEIDTGTRDDQAGRLAVIQEKLAVLTRASDQGSLLRDGAMVVLAGQPNVGKSSLLNRLAGEEVAIVTEIPGTTRDAIRQSINLFGVPVHVIDTAGIRETSGESADAVEQIGIARTWAAIEKADLAVLVIDATKGASAEDLAIAARLPQGLRCLRAFNKSDLAGKAAGRAGDEIVLSAKTGEGLDGLRGAIAEAIGWRGDAEGVFMARARHLEALRAAQAGLVRAATRMRQQELFAEELREAHEALMSITGEVTPDDLLGEIFSRFCIGK